MGEVFSDRLLVDCVYFLFAGTDGPTYAQGRTTHRCRLSAQKGQIMGQPVVHFEVIGKDPEKLQSYYGDLFGWKFDTSAPVSEAVSQPGNYGFVDRNTTSDGVGIPGGVGGGKGYDGYAIFYVGVPDVEAALQKAESL